MTKLTATLHNMRRAPYQSLAAVVMTTITFIVISLFALIIAGSHRLLIYFESRPQVIAFFKDTATDADVATLRTRMEGTGVAAEIKYLSKADALEIYRAQNQDNPLLLEMVTADILPSSLEVSAKSVKDLDTIAGAMREDASVEEVVYQKDVIDTLKKWIDGLRLAGIALSAILLVASLMTIMVILGMRVVVRKSEIQTLSLLGASPWYIRAPFLIEGVLYALSGVILGWSTTYLALLYLTPNFLSFFAGTPLFPVSPLLMLAILGGELLLGFFIGLIASSSATRRYGR